MEPLSIAVLLFGGMAAGFLAGFFGVGGGILLVPILLYYFQAMGVSSLVATHLTLGTSLFVVAFTSVSSAYEYTKNGHVVWKAAVTLGLASILGAWAGTSLAAGLEGRTLQRIFGLVVAVTAVRLLSERRKPKEAPEPKTGPIGLIITGLGVGVVSSLAGVGGGVFSIPVMYSIFRFPLKRALGTSSAAIVITGLAAATGYMVRGWGNTLLPPGTLGYVGYLYALPIIVGSIPLAKFGASLAHRTHPAHLQTIFAGFLFIVSAKMLFF